MLCRSQLFTLKNLHLYNLSTWDVASEVKVQLGSCNLTNTFTENIVTFTNNADGC